MASSTSRTWGATLGLIAVGLFAAAIYGTSYILGGGLARGAPVRAVFSSPGAGQQLPIGGDVKVRGVLVGRIADVSLSGDGKVVVTMELDNVGVGLPATTAAEIRSKTLFGQKWVELVPPPSAPGPTLGAIAVIPDARTREPIELERQLQLGHDLLSNIPLDDLALLLHSLAEGFGGSESDAAAAIDRGLVALRAVNARSSDLDRALRQLREFSEWLDDNDSTLLSFMQSLDAANRALVGAAPAFTSSLQSLPVFLDDLAAFQELTEGDLGRLVENGATVAEIVSARSDRLTDIVVQLEAFLTVWNSGLQQPCAGAFEDDMTCWQVYLLPGLESRGLYNRGRQPPNNNEPGDPGNGVIGKPATGAP